MKRINRKKLCENITAAAQFDLSQNNISGCSYAVISEGETVFKKHFGGVLPDGEKAVDDTTLFRLASMTKPVTAVAGNASARRFEKAVFESLEYNEIFSRFTENVVNKQ